MQAEVDGLAGLARDATGYGHEVVEHPLAPGHDAVVEGHRPVIGQGPDGDGGPVAPESLGCLIATRQMHEVDLRAHLADIGDGTVGAGPDTREADVLRVVGQLDWPADLTDRPPSRARGLPQLGQMERLPGRLTTVAAVVPVAVPPLDAVGVGVGHDHQQVGGCRQLLDVAGTGPLHVVATGSEPAEHGTAMTRRPRRQGQPHLTVPTDGDSMVRSRVRDRSPRPPRGVRRHQQAGRWSAAPMETRQGGHRGFRCLLRQAGSPPNAINTTMAAPAAHSLRMSSSPSMRGSGPPVARRGPGGQGVDRVSEPPAHRV